jgi:hypothetical protein
MRKVVEELKQLIEAYSTKISAIPEAEFSAKPLPHKWSRKEVLGHLIDSAQNNLRRFICSQYEQTPPKIVYDQDFWVKANGYQEVEKEEVIQMWKQINLRIAAVLGKMPKENFSRTADTGKTKMELHSLEFLAEDYVKHMKHHLNQIIPGSFDIVYK